MGLPRAEVARLMQRSESSVRNLLHRALAQLAGLLEPAG
jgi:DNA-directed RNA polymerase specialized sigma24 family protein